MINITVLASMTVDLYFLHYFHLDSLEVVQPWFKLSSKYYNLMEIQQEKEVALLENYKYRAKTRQHCYTKLCKVTQKCHIQGLVIK